MWLGDVSNGEFFHFQTKRERKMRDEILRRCDDNARKLGMDRREFISSSMGMLTTLSVFNMAAGCGDAKGFMAPTAVNNFMAGGAGGVAPGMPNGAGGVATPAQASSSMGVMGTAGNPFGAAGYGGQPGQVGAAGGGAAGYGGSGPMGGMGAGGKSGSGGRMTDGGFMVPNQACMDKALADRLLMQEYFIMDVQTHQADGPTIFECSSAMR